MFKQALSLLLCTVLSVTPAFAAHNHFNKLQQQQHRAMHEIVMTERDSDGKPTHGALCTAYAVGPHTLLTAEHCNLPKVNDVYIDASPELIKLQQVGSYAIVSRTFDHQDHMLIDLATTAHFKDTIELTDHVRLPRQGEHTYQWGCPGGQRDQYREGVVMGSVPNPTPDPDEEPIDATGRIYVIAEPVIGGDSGSAIFSADDGQLIGVVTYGMDEGQLTGMYAIVFTQAQIDAATK